MQFGMVLTAMRFTDMGEAMVPTFRAFILIGVSNSHEVFKSKTQLLKEISQFIHYLVSQFRGID